MADLEFPGRYEPVQRLGKGGGGEVWAVRERHTGSRYALKVLAWDASDREMAALVREAIALSGLEGLGVPRVMRFGRLPGSGRPYLVRELVEGDSLQDLVEAGVNVERTLEALASAAEQVTVLHRAGFLHGDIKPANVIVTESGAATLVDLGLAAPWQDAGTQPEGLTPKYAAPELFEGKPLTVRAEVYALGVALLETIRGAKAPLAPKTKRELEGVAHRATAEEPSSRHPSADEFASALRRAAGLKRGGAEDVGAAQVWPVVGMDATASSLQKAVAALEPGGALKLVGPEGAGKTVLLRRLAWSLGVEGRANAWIDASVVGDRTSVEAELATSESDRLFVLIDDSDRLDSPSVELVEAALRKGARLVFVGDAPIAQGAPEFQVPPLELRAASEIVKRAIPSLTERLMHRIVHASGARPGVLRGLVARIASEAIASEDDFERLLGPTGPSSTMIPEDLVARGLYFLDRGRFTEARAVLDGVTAGDPLVLETARARLELGEGESARALERLTAVADEAARRTGLAESKAWAVYVARAHLGVGSYAVAADLLEPLTKDRGSLGAEALAYQGLAFSYLGKPEVAVRTLENAVAAAHDARDARVEGVALASLGLAYQRSDRLDDAQTAYEKAIVAAEQAGDAGNLATTQLNLAGVLKVCGDIAGAIEHFESALDMGRRSGRRSTARQALLNLANNDLYVGRLARARARIEELDEQRAQLPPVARAQLMGLQAELAARSNQTQAAQRAYEACAAAYDALGRGVDAAEARLESVLVTLRTADADVSELARQVTRAESDLGDSLAHKPLRMLARARVTWAQGHDAAAREQLKATLDAARAAGQKEWLWRTLEARAYIEEASGRHLMARRDREEALAVLEDIGARLPRDLREVYWDDPRRRALRDGIYATLSHAATQFAAGVVPSTGAPPSLTQGAPAIAATGEVTVGSLDEQRLARILEINHELAGEHDLDRLTERITDHAVALLRGERGFVVLRDGEGRLTVHTSRHLGGDDPHAEFSRSIAEQVIATGEPVVSTSPATDSRLRGYASVHQLMLQSVACVPIAGPGRSAAGALYVETRVRPGAKFERELPALQAFADQVAIAIENARLITENRQRADALALANAELEEAQADLRELLQDRTAKLKRVRAKLRDAKDTLYGHFGYRGLVGTSAAMRKVYALVDRIKETDVPILITGESGTGKEVVARAIHVASDRRDKPFVGVNCGAIPEHLLESELFGHVRGAFTGADRDRRGLLREAEGGTILLDEIGEMPQKMQAGLLRVLQERKVRPVGGTAEEPVDVRIIFATHRDLDAMVKARTFREDLYYRIHVVEVRIPPLRERTDDIPPLVDHFLGIFSARYRREKKTLARDAMRRLSAYHWPGNVRQLEHVLLNSWVLSDSPELGAEDFDIPDGYVAKAPSSGTTTLSAASARARSISSQRPPKSTLSQHRRDERERILRALQSCNWNRVKAASLMGVPRRTFYRRLKEYGIQ